MQNKIDYLWAAETGSPADLIDAFTTTVMPAIRAITNQNAEYELIVCNQYHGGLSFAASAIAIGGTVTGDCLPPFVSWDFTLVRSAVGEQNGYKRFAGVSESKQQNGLVDAGFVSVLDNLATILQADLVGSLDTYQLGVRRSQINQIPVNTPTVQTISAAQYSKIGSQNSRKYGHGR